MPDDTLTSAELKRLNRSRCCLGYGWAQGSIVLASRYPCGGAIFRGKDMPEHARRVTTRVSCTKMLEPIETWFGLWTRVDRRIVI